MPHLAWCAAMALVALAAACGSPGLRTFPLREPMRVDPDRHPFGEKPAERFSPFAWDAADQTVFRPMSDLFAMPPTGEARNVNALDEVPDSSWFENRIGERRMSPARVAQAACHGPGLDPAQGPWRVIGGKPDGANPGFLIEDPRGQRYLVKFDNPHQPERATSADVIGSILYWAAGYHAPCNRIVYFDRNVLSLAKDASYEDSRGRPVPLTWQHVNEALAQAARGPDGRYRASASRFVEGEPLGSWRYQGTRGDDPNDVVAHQDRRELRANFVLASWINHFDTREKNTLATWVPAGDGLGYVRHYYLDFGDSLGSLWPWDGVSRRLGHAHYLDVGYLLADMFTFGLVRRPWDVEGYGPGGQTFGYFGVERFDAEAWKPGYPNPAFRRMTEHDAAWMARIVAHVRDPHLRAIVSQARLSDPQLRDVLLRILKARRDRILERWLSRLSPLTHPRLTRAPAPAHTALCLRDLAVYAGLTAPDARAYRTAAWTGETPAPVEVGAAWRDPGREEVCVTLPDPPASTRSPAYLVVDVRGVSPGPLGQAGPARVHLYALGHGRFRIVALERPEAGAGPPGD